MSKAHWKFTLSQMLKTRMEMLVCGLEVDSIDRLAVEMTEFWGFDDLVDWYQKQTTMQQQHMAI